MNRKDKNIVGVLLSGGEGKRLWPLSTSFRPKQFIKLGENALIEHTIARNNPLVDEFIAVSNKRYRFLIEQGFTKAAEKPHRAIYETIGRNTAPAITFATLTAQPDDILFAMPTDASIDGLDRYRARVSEAIDLAAQDCIVTLGISPTSPHTGYGYILRSGNDIIRFVEKPTWEKATEYVRSGDYLWNSGMFIFRAQTMIEELERHCPDILQSCREALDAAQTDGGDNAIVLPADRMEGIRSESIDYAVIEKSDRLKVVPADFSWDDLGSIESLADTLPQDRERNRVSGDNIILNECEHTSVVNAGANNLVVANGLSDVVIANTNDVVYISKRGRSQDIKDILSDNEAELGRYVPANIWNDQPWGFYEVLFNTPHYRVRRLTIEPHETAEIDDSSYEMVHFISVVGEGAVHTGCDSRRLAAPDSLGVLSEPSLSIENDTDGPLRIIEIAIGPASEVLDSIRPECGGGR